KPSSRSPCGPRAPPRQTRRACRAASRTTVSGAERSPAFDRLNRAGIASSPKWPTIATEGPRLSGLASPRSRRRIPPAVPVRRLPRTVSPTTSTDA
ncbi:hypothetical protein BBIA_2397, partial [Bifidobacterium biavatii DSM 23969]